MLNFNHALSNVYNCFVKSESSESQLNYKLQYAIHNRSYDKVIELIQQGADCTQIVKVDRNRALDNFKRIVFNPTYHEIADLILKSSSSEDLSTIFKQADFNSALRLYPKFDIQFTKLYLAYFMELPLPFLAIIENQEIVVDAVCQRGINFNSSYPSSSVPIEEWGGIVAGDKNDIKNSFYRFVTLMMFPFFLTTTNNQILKLFKNFDMDLGVIFDLGKELYVNGLLAGNLQLIKLAIECKKDHAICIADRFGNKVDATMVCAAQGANVEILDMLFERGYDINPDVNNSWRFLHNKLNKPFETALLAGNFDAAKWFLKHGADFDFSLENGSSRRFFKEIAATGRPSQILFLLSQGCLLKFIENDETISFVDIAVMHHNEANIRLGHRLGYNLSNSLRYCIQEITDDSETQKTEKLSNIETIDLLKKLGADLNCIFDGGVNLFYDAVRFGLKEEFEYLLKLGLNPHAASNRYGNLSIAAASSNSLELLKKIAGLGVDCGFITDYNENALFYADKEDVIDYLIAQGLDVNHVNIDGQTPLFGSLDIETTQALIKNGANVNHIDNLGNTPLFYARDAKIAQLLLNHGANPHHLNLKKETILFTGRGDGELIDLLVQQGLNIEHENINGETALMVVAQDADEAYVNKLIKLGANPHHKNQQGQTAFDIIVTDNLEYMKQGPEYLGFYEWVLMDLDSDKAHDLISSLYKDFKLNW